MSNERRRKLLSLIIVLTVTAFVATIVCVLTTASTENIQLNVGDFADRNVFAGRTIENRVASEQKRKEAQNNVTPLYKHDTEITDLVLASVDTFFAQIAEYRAAYVPIIGSDGSQSEAELDISAIDIDTFDVELNSEQLTLLITSDSAKFNEFYTVVRAQVEETMADGVREESLARSLQVIGDTLEDAELASGWAEIGGEIAKAVLKPNLVIDEEATKKATEEAVLAVDSVMYYEGQKVIGEGEIVTDEVYAALEDLGLLSNGFQKRIPSVIGSVAVCALSFALLFVYIYYSNRQIVSSGRLMCLLFTLYMIFLVGTTFIQQLTSFAVPIFLVTMLVSVLINNRLAIAMSISMTVIGFVICDGNVIFLVFYGALGILYAELGKVVGERNKVFSVSLEVAVANAVLVLALNLLVNQEYSAGILNDILYAVINGLLSVLLTIGSLPLWEALFGIVTPVKLLDLTNPGSELMRRLGMEAPGTYQHSLIVANLAEAAAYDIGANQILARVGAYYHDIGKLKAPKYFGENQYGENPHDSMEPRESAKMLIEHVSYGLELADEFKLPQQMRDIIEQHHGNTLIKFFYYKEKNAHPDEKIDANDFRYPFRRPISRESGIVMLADTSEAAVRSIISQGKNYDEIEDFIATLIKDKLEDGQLDNCSLTIKDLNTIRKSFMRIFKAIYHERIPYPKGTTKELEE